MTKLMPKEMRETGPAMPRAASRFALKAQEGEALQAYKSLSEITAACVACYTGYKIK